MTDEIVLHCDGLHHWFGDNRVLFDLNFRIIEGEIVALVGPSGCGKSTLLRAIVGTHPPRQGRVLVADRRAGHRPQEVRAPGRDRGIVYQHYTLFPFLTARENVAVGLQLDQTSLPFRVLHPRASRALRKRHLGAASEFLERLGLGKAADRYPQQMSGGMCQRVAIAQALIMKPRILLLDEPFGALDEATREDLQRLLLTLYMENRQARQQDRSPPYTILIVTHELNEALFVGDRVLGLSQYWNWQQDDHGRFPGATIVYDSVAPVYGPDEQRDYELLRSQREEIRRAVFSPELLQQREQFRRFWDQLASGEGQGILGR
jgi:NitT/TauT family transport system ATP-binding protein